MKQCVNNYDTPLTHISTIAQWYFPDEWKLGKVIPIFKDRDPQDIQNYRLISGLPFSLKFLKNLFISSLLNF